MKDLRDFVGPDHAADLDELETMLNAMSLDQLAFFCRQMLVVATLSQQVFMRRDPVGWQAFDAEIEGGD